MLGRYVESRYHGQIESVGIEKLFRSADVVFGNLESCFGGDEQPVTQEQIVLKASDKAASVLKYFGFTVLSLANNHCGDYGFGAISHSQHLLNSYGIKSFGGSSQFGEAAPLIFKIKDATLGFLGYSAHVASATYSQPDYRGIAPFLPESVVGDIKTLRPQVDVLLVSIHWGQEYADKPTAEQIILAHRLIDAGADVVMGHHPHVLQGIENYKGKVIAYSLGNFIFDQRQPKTTESVILQMKIKKGEIIFVDSIPIVIDNYVPRLASDKESHTIRSRLERDSKLLNRLSK